MSTPITARSVSPAPAAALAEFMYMPGGVQHIHCGQGGKDVSVSVLVDAATAENLERQRALLCQKGAHRPYFDFDHDDKQASFWPSEFVWRNAPAPGVYARGEWSAAGAAAVEGKTYRAFSPKFHVDGVKKNPARVICHEGASLNMGGLVNDPAFRNNLPLWAKRAVAPRQSQTTAATPQLSTHHMKTAQEVAALTARKSELETEIHSLHAAATGTAEDADALQAKQGELDQVVSDLKIAELEAQNAEKDKALLAQRTSDAKKAVLAAVSRGAIATKDTVLQAKWEQALIEDPSMITMLTAAKGSAALDAGSRPVLPRLQVTNIAITRASNKDMLAGMQAIAAKNFGEQRYHRKIEAAAELAALYAKEILPRLKEGDDIPLEADNTYGTLVSSLTSIRTLELLTLTFPLLSRISTDFSNEIVRYGDTLTSRITGIPSVSSYNQTTGWSQSDVTSPDVSITYNRKRGVEVRIDDQTINSTVRRLFDEYAPAQAYALGKDIVDYIYALITSAFTNTVTQAGLGTFGRSTVVDIGTILDGTANPSAGRFLLLNAQYYGALKKDQTIVLLAANQRAGIIENGVLPAVEDFDVIKAVNLPATVISGATVLKGFGGTRSSLLVASRLSADYMNALPGAGNGTMTVVSTPGGFSANQINYVNNQLATANSRLEIIYGANRGQVAAGALLTDV